MQKQQQQDTTEIDVSRLFWKKLKCTYALFGRLTPASMSCNTLSSGIFTMSLGP